MYHVLVKVSSIQATNGGLYKQNIKEPQKIVTHLLHDLSQKPMEL